MLQQALYLTQISSCVNPQAQGRGDQHQPHTSDIQNSCVHSLNFYLPPTGKILENKRIVKSGFVRNGR